MVDLFSPRSGRNPVASPVRAWTKSNPSHPQARLRCSSNTVTPNEREGPDYSVKFHPNRPSSIVNQPPPVSPSPASPSPARIPPHKSLDAAAGWIFAEDWGCDLRTDIKNRRSSNFTRRRNPSSGKPGTENRGQSQSCSALDLHGF